MEIGYCYFCFSVVVNCNGGYVELLSISFNDQLCYLYLKKETSL